MKKLHLVLLAVLGLLSPLNVMAQTNVTSSGLSVQGIARDDKNEALANVDQLDLKFEVYYFIGASTTPTIILTSTATIKTDNFGVFSYVVGINQGQANLISTQSAYLRVSSANVVFSDEKCSLFYLCSKRCSYWFNYAFYRIRGSQWLVALRWKRNS
jgi:hypothetical protein